MNPLFRCANCGKETKIPRVGNVTLICQQCGCSDISFDKDVLASPANPGDISSHQIVKANDPFLGATKNGSIWNIIFPLPEVKREVVPLITRRK
jgi:hypothetical protein